MCLGKNLEGEVMHSAKHVAVFSVISIKLFLSDNLMLVYRLEERKMLNDALYSHEYAEYDEHIDL